MPYDNTARNDHRSTYSKGEENENGGTHLARSDRRLLISIAAVYRVYKCVEIGQNALRVLPAAGNGSRERTLDLRR